MTETIVISLDIDWAPDFMIDAAARKLADAKVPATFFVTHKSPALDRLREHGDLFELGIHPNFNPGSEHGTTSTEVVEFCKQMVPEAVSIRTHGLIQSAALLDVLMTVGDMQTDCSLYLRHALRQQSSSYWWNKRHLLRLPTLWDDNFEMHAMSPLWSVESLLGSPGIKLFNFHPVHLYLNNAEVAAYTTLKNRAPHLAKATEEQCRDLVTDGVGSGTTFSALISLVRDGRACRVCDIPRSLP